MEVLQLTEVLKELFLMPVELKSKFYLKFGKVMIGDDLIGSSMPNYNSSSSMIMANWPADPSSQHPDCSVGEVQYFMEVLITHIQSVPVVRKHVFAFVHWRKTHVNSGAFPKELAILCEALTYPYCKWNFLPIHRISNHIAHVTMPFSFSENYTETVTAACPLPLRVKFSLFQKQYAFSIGNFFISECRYWLLLVNVFAMCFVFSCYLNYIPTCRL